MIAVQYELQKKFLKIYDIIFCPQIFKLNFTTIHLDGLNLFYL